MGDDIRVFVTWILALIITQSLSLRQGFIRRFALATLMIGFMTLPYLQLAMGGSNTERVSLERGISIANPNDLAAWFGFCGVYFFISGIEAKRSIIRTINWFVSIGCLGVVGLTVSRGAFIAVGIAAIVAIRHLLKRGFLPLLLLFILSWIVYLSGLFDQAAHLYTERGMEETGRLITWPVAIETFLNSPLAGVGAAGAALSVPGASKLITPHNNFLYIAVSSGIIPLAFFVAYWWQAARATFRSSYDSTGHARFRFPLYIYALLIAQAGNLSFMYPWMIATLASEKIGYRFRTKRRSRLYRPIPPRIERFQARLDRRKVKLEQQRM
jgi:O-antigen ligase